MYSPRVRTTSHRLSPNRKIFRLIGWCLRVCGKFARPGREARPSWLTYFGERGRSEPAYASLCDTTIGSFKHISYNIPSYVFLLLLLVFLGFSSGSVVEFLCCLLSIVDHRQHCRCNLQRHIVFSREHYWSWAPWKMGETAREAVTLKDKREMTAQNQDANTRDINHMGLTSTVKWERLVPGVLLRLRVLLVEADDSTCRIIAALLRRCSYRVAAVSDGLRAWETLKGKPHNVDLILTEVELPSISGYALLTLVMEHEICKSIPVIMMSSKDSINLILKCMLKGAADFLIKPVRRNELRNLWQHVWRRQIQTAGDFHHSAAVVEQKVEATFENNVTSNTSNDGMALTEKNHQVSVEESDTQSSCTAPYTGAESAYVSNMQDVFTRIYADACKLNDTKVHEECAKIIEESAMAKSGTETNIVKYGEQLAPCNEAYDSVTVKMGDHHLVAKSIVKKPRSHNSIDEMSSGTEELVKPQSIVDLTRNFIKCEPNADGQWCAKNSIQNFNVSPPLELSLGRFFPTHSKDGGNEEQHKLRQSKASAFSKYDNKKICQPVFPTMTGVSAVSKENANASDNQLFNQHCAFFTLWGHGAAFTNGQENLTSSEPGQSGKSRGEFPQVGFGFFAVPRVRSEGGHCPPMLHAQPGFPVWSSKSQHEQSPIPTGSATRSNFEVQKPEQGFCSFEQTANASAEEKEQASYNKLETMEAKRVFSPTTGSCYFCSSVANNLGTAVSASICSISEENSTPAPDNRTTDL